MRSGERVNSRNAYPGRIVDELERQGEADRCHVAAVRQTLDRQDWKKRSTPPLPVHLPDNPKVRELHVQPHDLNRYATLGALDDDR